MERKIKLLYAEDEKQMRITYTEILSKQGFDVYAVTNGDEAWEAYQKDEWDILLLDIEMPEKTGEEVIRLIRENDTQVPIVVFTGYDQEGLSVMEADGGADDYVSKDWSVKVLVDRLGKRLKDAMRRAERGEQRVFRLSSRMTYDKVTNILTIDGKATKLKGMQGKIMLIFCTRRNEEIKSTELCKELWNFDDDLKKGELSTYISQLRKILKADSSVEIVNNNGCYLLVVPDK